MSTWGCATILRNLPFRRQSQPFEAERRQHASSFSATNFSLALTFYHPFFHWGEDDVSREIERQA